MRDMDGHPVEVRCRPPMMLHELTSDGANQAEPSRPPVCRRRRCRCCRGTTVSASRTRSSGISSSPPKPMHAAPVRGAAEDFVDHFMAYRDTRCPASARRHRAAGADGRAHAGP